MKKMIQRNLASAKTTFNFLILALFFTGSTWAADRNPEAHEHGAGIMNIAIQGNEVEIELELPADNVVGFEHEARTVTEKKRVQDAAAKLKKAANVVVLPKDAVCKLEKAEIESALLEDHDDHKEHGHKDDRDDHGKSREKDDHGDHSEFTAHYYFECAKIGELSNLDISLFKHFPSTRKLQVQYITPKRQGAAQATPNSARIKLN
jgi:hypothetical protein